MKLTNTRTTFPENFLWGSASAAYQIEGGYQSGNKGMSVWDTFVRIPGKTYKATTGDKAVDHYHRFKKDIALMAEMGLQTYRFSIAWSRIYPKGNGKLNPEGIAFYHELIDECLHYGIEPMVTIYHWDLPQALQDAYGGWENRQIVEDYLNYAKTLFQEYGSKVKYWITMNEQNVFTRLGWMSGAHPPGKVDEEKMFYQVNHHAFMAHAKTVLAFQQYVPNGMIGASFNYHASYAKDAHPEHVIAKADYDDITNYWWLDMYGYGHYPRTAWRYVKDRGVAPHMEAEDADILKKAADCLDFLGVNYYRTDMIAYCDEQEESASMVFNTTGKKGTTQTAKVPGMYQVPLNPFLPTTDWDWTIDPSGLRFCCREITSRYDLPIIITENGLGAFDKVEDGEIHDPYRIAYLKAHILELKKAIDEGCRVLAYCTWSFTDLLSWLNGYQKRYGFVYIDRQEEENSGTLSRIKKDSFHWYAQVIKSNGEKL